MADKPISEDLLFIDCEFNGWNGDLITMAIVDNDGREFYEYHVLDQSIDLNLWVVGNVMPCIGKLPISGEEFREKLWSFLSHYKDGFKLIADWPEDILHFTRNILTGDGRMINIPKFEMIVDTKILNIKPKKHHNALEDAKALRQGYNETYGK